MRLDERDLLHTWATSALAFTHALATLEPQWASNAQPVGGGWLVLSGRGLYVNRAIAAGVDRPLSADDIELIVEHSRRAEVTPAIEVTPHTAPASVRQLADRGFVHTAHADVTALVRTTDNASLSPDANFVVRSVRSAADLALWQDTSARGWGHATTDARRASDAFSRAAFAVDGDGMVVAFDADDARPVGAASTTFQDGIATLGGMSTLPAERRRGVQSALVHHRLTVAAERGFRIAASTAARGGASERNLIRHGFEARFVIQTWELAPDSRA